MPNGLVTCFHPLSKIENNQHGHVYIDSYNVIVSIYIFCYCYCYFILVNSFHPFQELR